MKNLENLINQILDLHSYITKNWPLDKNYQKLNMVKTRVHDVYNNQDIFFRILNYRDFLIKNNVDAYFNSLNDNYIEARIKNKNSIQYKIESYTNSKEHEYGHIPLKKCLNDIFGIRIILKDGSQEDIWNWLKTRFSSLKITNSNKNKGDYRAIHVYFGNGNNNIYQWELQIWLDKDKENNYISHEKYKQDYVKWENEGGV